MRPLLRALFALPCDAFDLRRVLSVQSQAKTCEAAPPMTWFLSMRVMRDGQTAEGVSLFSIDGKETIHNSTRDRVCTCWFAGSLEQCMSVRRCPDALRLRRSPPPGSASRT